MLSAASASDVGMPAPATALVSAVLGAGLCGKKFPVTEAALQVQNR